LIHFATVRVAATLVAVSVGLSAVQEGTRVVPADARALADAGLYEEAEAAARGAVEARRVLHGDAALEVATSSDVLVQVLVLNGRAADGGTLALAQRTLGIKEAQLGASHPALVSSQLNLADVLVAAAEFERAIAVTQLALASCQRSAGPDSLEVAEALDHFGNSLAAAERYSEAVRALERGLRLKEKALDGSDVSIARTLESLGLVLQNSGDYDRAGSAVRRAAAIQELSDSNHPAYVGTLNLVAQQLWFEGRLLESRAASERAVALAERTLRPDHPTLALSLRFLASTLGDLGDSSRSLELKRRALAIAERNFGPDHHVTAAYVHSLGLAELNQGDYSAARRHFQQALSSYQARYGQWHEFVATAHSVLALSDARLGDYVNAQREQSRAIATFSRVGGPTHPYVANALTKLAGVYLEQGRPAQALPLLERALAIREKALNPQHRDIARTLVDLAATLMQTGQPVRAQQLARRALGIWERLDAPDAPDHATVLALYAELQASRGDSAAARDYYARAMTIRAKVFGRSNPVFAEAQAGFALALANLGERDTALRTALDAEATGRDHLRLMLRSLPERQALNYAASRPRGLNLIFSLSNSMPDAVPMALDGFIRSRALVLDEIAARHSAGRTDPARAALASAQQRLANLSVRGPEQMSPDQYAALVEDARRESERAEQALAERSVEFRAEQSRAQVGLSEVMTSLPADTALLSFARYDRTFFPVQKPPASPNESGRSSSRTLPSYVAFVLRSDQRPVAVPLGSVQSVDALVSRWRADIQTEALAPAGSVGSGASSRESGRELRRILWDRAAAYVGDAKHVFIVPDGSLGLVPFEAFPTGQRSYLLETGPVIHYLSAERDLVPRPYVAGPERGLLALGGPSFDDGSLLRTSPIPATPSKSTTEQATIRGVSSPCNGLASVTFPPLGGTLREVRDIANLWNGSSTAEAQSAQILVGREASEGQFKREAPGHRVLHVATHGFFLSGDCPLGLSDTRGVGGLAVARPATVVENPLLLSGLALAGANRRSRARPDEDDGILTAEEVAMLDLQGVEWAVLSACDTGVGEIKAGEGVFGLRRAFQVAGARTVIMSLWSVDDQATRAWMRALYEGRFQKRLSTADAVHQAGLSVLRDRRARGQSTHPFFWAAFVAAGDWR